MKAKRYGDEKTHLRLTGKAQLFYSNTDPLVILEHTEITDEGEESYTYTMDGCIAVYEPISEEELIQILTAFYDDL